MSLLKNVLSSAFSLTKKADSSGSVGSSVGGSDQRSSGPKSGNDPVWQMLDAETGVQNFSYPDNPRNDIHALFGHPPRCVLDIGCATGAVGLGLKQAFPHVWVWGCELNARAAQVAQGRLDRVSAVPREQWSSAELELLRNVDTVLLLDVLEHMYNPWAELRFLRQQLPQGAQVVVSLPNAGHMSVLVNLAAGSFKYESAGILDITHIRFFTLAEMRAMFEQTGFTIEREAILSSSQGPQPGSFPTDLSAGKLTLRVNSQVEWQELNAVQFGFSLTLSQ